MTDVSDCFTPLGWPCPRCCSVQFDPVLLYVHRDRRTIRDGEPRTATSTFTQLLSSDVVADVYRFYIALFSALEQTHCALVRVHPKHQFPEHFPHVSASAGYIIIATPPFILKKNCRVTLRLVSVSYRGYV